MINIMPFDWLFKSPLRFRRLRSLSELIHIKLFALQWRASIEIRNRSLYFNFHFLEPYKFNFSSIEPK